MKNRFIYLARKKSPEALPEFERPSGREALAEDVSRKQLESNLENLGVEVAAELLKQGKLEVPPSVGKYFSLRDEFLSKVELFYKDKEPKRAYNGLRRYYKSFEALLPLGIDILDEDIRETMDVIKERMASMKAIELEDEIREAVKPHKEYIKVVKDPIYGFEVQLTPAFVELTKVDEYYLSDAEKLKIDSVTKLVLRLSGKLTLKREEAGVEVESREYMRDFYRANSALSEGNYIEAKKLYKRFIKTGWKEQKVAGTQKKFRESPEYLKAKECLKRIGLMECDLAENRLRVLEMSVTNTPAGWTYGRGKQKYGISKPEALKIVESQRTVLGLARDIIEADNRILTLESAIKQIGGLKYQDIEARLEEWGLSEKARYVKDVYGDWDKRGIAFFNSKFGKKGLLHLDAVRLIIDEQGKIDPKTVKARADYYKEMGLYEAAEAVYDFYFRELYKKYEKEMEGGREIFFEAYGKTHMVDLAKKVDSVVQDIEKDGETIVSNNERDLIKQKLIGRAWKKAVRQKITAACNAEVGDEWGKTRVQRAGLPFGVLAGLGAEPTKKSIEYKWLDYNNDILQVDRKWYELWKFTCREWDEFLSTAAVDLFFILVSAGGAHLAGKATARAVSKSLLTKEFVKLGVVEAFRAGGSRAATRVLISKIGGKTIQTLGKELGTKRITQLSKILGFGAESLAFSELMMVSGILRSGDLSAMMSFEKHLENWGHSVVTLGTIKGVGMATKGLKIPKGVKGMVNVTIDTALLTGIGVGTAAITGEKLSETDILKMIRNNAVLSVGIRGFGRLKNWAQSRKVSLNRLLEARLAIEAGLEKVTAPVVEAAAEVRGLRRELAKTTSPSKKAEIEKRLKEQEAEHAKLEKEITYLEEQRGQLETAIEHTPSEGFMKLILSPNVQDFHTAIKILESAKRLRLSPTELLYIASKLPLSHQTTFLSRISSPKFMSPSMRRAFVAELKNLGINDVPKGFMPEVKMLITRLDMYRSHLMGLMFTAQLTLGVVGAFQGRAVERPGIVRVEAKAKDFKGDGLLVVKGGEFDNMPASSNRSSALIIKLGDVGTNVREFDAPKTRQLFSRDQSDIIDALDKAGVDRNLSSRLKSLFDGLMPELKPYFRVFASVDEKGNALPYLVVDQEGLNDVMGRVLKENPYDTIEALRDLGLTAPEDIERMKIAKADFWTLNILWDVITGLPGFLIAHPDLAVILSGLILIKSRRARRWTGRRISRWRKRRKEAKESKTGEGREKVGELPGMNEILGEVVTDVKEAMNNLGELQPEFRRFFRFAKDRFDELDFADKGEARDLFVALIKSKYIDLRSSRIKKAFTEGNGTEAMKTELNSLIEQKDAVLREIADNDLSIFPLGKAELATLSKKIKGELERSLREEGWKDAEISSAKAVVDNFMNLIQLYEPGSGLRDIRALKIKMDFWEQKHKMSKNVEKPAEDASVKERADYAGAQKFIKFYRGLENKYQEALNNMNRRQRLADRIDSKLPTNVRRREIMLKALKYALGGGLVYLGYKWLGEEEEGGESAPPKPGTPEETKKRLKEERERKKIEESEKAADNIIIRSQPKKPKKQKKTAPKSNKRSVRQTKSPLSEETKEPVDTRNRRDQLLDLLE